MKKGVDDELIKFHTENILFIFCVMFLVSLALFWLGVFFFLLHRAGGSQHLYGGSITLVKIVVQAYFWLVVLTLGGPALFIVYIYIIGV